MFDTLRALLRPATAPRTETAPDVAIAALMVEAACADGHYDPDEADRIAHLLARLLDLSPDEARRLRQAGEAAQAEAPDLVRFTRAVKWALDEGARADLFQALWGVVISDGRRDPEEDALMRRLAPLVGVDDDVSAAARRRALKDRGL
jgi:uncharacterized tellurite resistance protein B-like protein